MVAEMREQGFAVQSAVAGAGVPSGACFVVAIVATGDWLEGVGMGRGVEIDDVFTPVCVGGLLGFG